MEEEEREAQSAKLQELIRRGNPEDLQEANRLMKVMAGFDTRSKTDYRAKAAEDVGKIQAKARLLEERLAAFKPGDKMTEGDVFEELASALSSAQPKIQKMCEEESDDHEAVAKLLEINDSIHRTVERWKLLKKGDIDGANAIAQGAPIQSLQSSGGQASSSSVANELSLIDFDADASGTNGSANNGESSSQAAGVENDLLGLSLDGNSSTFGQGGGISLGFGANSSMSFHYPQIADASLTLAADIPGQPLLSSMTQNSNATGAANAPTPPSYTQFSGFTSPPSGSQASTPQPQGPSAFSQPPSQKASDPFAALASPMFGSKPATPQPLAMAAAPAPPAPATAANEDDEWSFSSALPVETPSLPKDHAAVVKTGEVQIDMKAARSVQSANALALSFAFSSNTAQPVSELHFQLAVTKVCNTHYTSSNLPDPHKILPGYSD